MRKDDIPKLFNAFEQANKTKNRNVVGTGLGLPICKSFVDMMDGEIIVESEYGVGSAFTVRLPLIRGNPEKLQKEETAGLEHTISAPEAKILVIDDNAFNIKVASGLLSLMDVEAETADSGAKAIALVIRNDYDIVFMDHMMPEMDGIETVQAIRQLGGKYESLIIVALTANAITGAREMFLRNGFNDFISKPIDVNELRDILIRHLPHEKVRKPVENENPFASLEKVEQLRQKSIVTFAKDNQTTFEKITSSLDSGDTRTAHRIAHTLKSSAGYLGRNELHDAAFSLEQSLQNEPAGYTTDQLENIERELKKALVDFEPLLKKAELERLVTMKISAEETVSLLKELKPLLEKCVFSSSDYVERLQGIDGMEELANRIDDFDYEGALSLLNELSHRFEKAADE